MVNQVCPRCGNKDPSLFYRGSKGVYCRACIRFSRHLLSETKQEEWDDYPVNLDSDYHLDFTLTPEQKRISNEIVHWMKKKDVLVWAVTGAGKTELCMDFISQCLKEKKRIAVVIARRQVVLELADRFRKAFSCHVCAVCEGHTQDLSGDLLVLTAHQCYRFFEKPFDHIIVDEPDAFPYHNNPVLQGIVRNSCKETMLYLSATPDQTLRDDCQVLQLFSRPHGHDLPVPSVRKSSSFYSLAQLFFWVSYRAERAIPFLVFVPTIKNAQRIEFLMKPFFGVASCTSKTKQKDERIQQFKQKQLAGLICTTVLERGVTFEGVDVCVWHADHPTFTAASLVQIAGRVGRKPSRPTGDCLFLVFSKSRSVEESIEMIQYANQNKMSILRQSTA